MQRWHARRHQNKHTNCDGSWTMKSNEETQKNREAKQGAYEFIESNKSFGVLNI